MLRAVAVVYAALAMCAAAAGQEPLAIHLSAGTARSVTPEEDRRLEAAFRAAQKQADDLAAASKKQHGKSQEAWPEAAREELRLARDAAAQAQTDWFYSGIPQKDIDDPGRHGPGRSRRGVPIEEERAVAGGREVFFVAAGQAADAFERFAAENAGKVAAARTR